MLLKKVQLITLYFVITLGLIFLYSFNPATTNGLYPPSLSREWGNFYCPGCGMFRALHQLLHGNWLLALRYNPLLIISIPLIIYWITPPFLKYFYDLHAYAVPHPKRQLLSFLTICLFYGVLRNISIPALFWLIPPS